MRSVQALLLAALLALSSAAAQDARFVPVEIFLDSAQPVAAWQFELVDRNGRMTVVGVENGASKAFTGAPYYDRPATQAGEVERIVVVDYTLADAPELPTGRTRIATVHLMIVGEADFEVTLVTATTADGQQIDASISLLLASFD